MRDSTYRMGVNFNYSYIIFRAFRICMFTKCVVFLCRRKADDLSREKSHFAVEANKNKNIAAELENR